MNFSKSILLLLIVVSNTDLIAIFWNQTATLVAKPVPVSPDTMNQNLVLNVNFSPTQIKAPISFPDTLFSNLPIKQWGTKTSFFFYNNRYLLTVASFATGYIFLCNFLVKGNRFLERTDTWSSWRSEIPLETLITVNQQELAKELIVEIQRRYSNPNNPTDFITPLISFVHVIDQEIQLLNTYIVWYGWISRLHMRDLLPINQKLFNLLSDKNKKNQYLKNLFLLWAADYKINHNKKGQQYISPACPSYIK